MKLPEILCGGKKYQVAKVICVGRNYAEHAKELGNEIPEFPLVFMKPPSNIGFSGAVVEFPPHSTDLQYETELVLLIGKDIKNVDEAEAENAITGYAAGFDFTLRDIQMDAKKRGIPWTLAKCFDNAAILSEFKSKEEYKIDLSEEILLHVNGVERQRAELNLMLFKPAQIVSYLSHKMTINEGDLIFTGTPGGVGSLSKGDKLKASISNIANLEAEIG
ncbi:MAG: fumarylacetoacetate hydrolase family protein [Ignavibacteriaceae bacterium]|nr:fumarylacetoacetate hydrolase family protein [Ignavibacteriaceae bacterium]